jgi:hypothetical protein
LISTIEQVELSRKRGEITMTIPMALDVFSIDKIFAETDEIIATKHDISLLLFPATPSPLQNNITSAPVRGMRKIIISVT